MVPNGATHHRLLHLCKCSAFHFLVQIYYMDTVSWPGLTSPWKSSLLKELSCFEFCNAICSICRRSILVVFLGIVLLLRYSTALLIFHYSVVFRLFRQCSVVLILTKVTCCTGRKCKIKKIKKIPVLFSRYQWTWFLLELEEANFAIELL